MYSTEILLNTAMIGGVNSAEIDSNFTARETRRKSSEIQQKRRYQYAYTIKRTLHASSKI